MPENEKEIPVETEARDEEVSAQATEEEETAPAEAREPEDPEALHARLREAEAKAEERWEQCLRLQAEIENLRKRSERDIANAHRYGLEKFASELLPVKDSLEMGLVATAESQHVDPEKLKEGMELTLRMLATAMEKFGIKEINPIGEKFNPDYHEAMSMQEREDVEPNTVVQVVQKGYTLNERLLRPAMVIVARAPAPANQDAGA